MEKDKKILGLQKNVFVLGLTSLFNDFSNEMILAIFPAFFTSVLKSGAASLGLVEGLADAMANFIKIYSGRISDKIQKRKIFAILGYSLSVAIRPFYILTGAIGGILGLRLIDRVGKGLREPPRDALISLSVNKEELGRSFGYHRAMDSIGGILGPLVAFFILKSFPFGFNLVFMTAFLVGLIAIFSLFFVKEVSAVARNGDFKLARLKDFSSRFKIYIFSVFILSA
ncbi:MAG TPA: MFS transporter, partial [Candidatus Paceibacterota bacterium]